MGDNDKGGHRLVRPLHNAVGNPLSVSIWRWWVVEAIWLDWVGDRMPGELYVGFEIKLDIVPQPSLLANRHVMFLDFVHEGVNHVDCSQVVLDHTGALKQQEQVIYYKYLYVPPTTI